MRFLLSSLPFITVAYSVAINKPYQELVEHERIEALPTGWKAIVPAAQDELLTLRVYLKHSNKDFIRIAEAVSDPSSPQYGNHLDHDQLRLALPDFDEPSASVLSWLSASRIDDHTIGDDWIDFSTTASRAHKLFNASFASYQYRNEETVLRTKSYSVPKELSNDIDFVFPTIHFFSSTRGRDISALERRQHFPTGPQNCTNNVCPSELKTKYNINYRPANGSSGSRIGIAGFLDEFPNITDVNSFLSQYGISKSYPAPNLNIISVNNGTKKIPSGSGALTVEAELDVDYVTAFTGPLPATFISVGGRGTQLSQPGNKPVSMSNNEPYLEFMQWLLAQKNPPQVISISYSDDEQSVPIAYARRVCDLFAQAATRGISIIGSSGDGGASGSGGDSTCVGPNGKRRFIPTFPSSCPWYTSVGATAGYGGSASFSSGGLSNYFARPPWQDQAVPAYIKELNGTHKGFYNASGRGIPDVSLLGDNYLTLTGGFAAPHSGTSASAPVFAAMIALINDIRLCAGKPVLGFLNPMLYAQKAAGVYRDVADGSQSGGCSDGNFFEPGWEALKGWDAATGLGEPDFDKLRKVFA